MLGDLSVGALFRITSGDVILCAILVFLLLAIGLVFFAVQVLINCALLINKTLHLIHSVKRVVHRHEHVPDDT